MTKQTWKTMMARLTLVSACALYLAGCTERVALGSEAIKGKTPDGTIDDVGGVGVGGVGVSTIEATGEVYNLRDLRQFPGTYGQARYGFAIGTASAGDLWLQNEAGVILHLKAKRTGLMLSLGGDAMVISMR
jgi:hypothetical protein